MIYFFKCTSISTIKSDAPNVGFQSLILARNTKHKFCPPINTQKRSNVYIVILYTGVSVFQEFVLGGCVSLTEQDAGDISDL